MSALDLRIHVTPRQLEILRMMSNGYTYTDIAKVLHLSPHTVRQHMKDIRNNLGATNAASAVAIALRTGLIE